MFLSECSFEKSTLFNLQKFYSLKKTFASSPDMPKQNEKQLNIRNMVCPRCVMVVRETLEGLGHEVKEVELGSAVITYSGTLDLEEIDRQLKEYGFELIKGADQDLVDSLCTGS
jgi:copper chaperone CopZ